MQLYNCVNEVKQYRKLLWMVKEQHRGHLLSHWYLFFELCNCHVREGHSSHEHVSLRLTVLHSDVQSRRKEAQLTLPALFLEPDGQKHQ